MTLTKKFELEKENKKAFGISKKIFLPIGVGLSVLIILEIWVSHTFVVSGAKLEEIENLESKITLENQLLEANIASASALINVASQAATLGLNAPSDIKYIR